MAQNRSKKDTWELKQEALMCCSNSAMNVHVGQLNFSLYSAYVGMTMKAPPTLILELWIYLSKQANSQICNPQDEEQLLPAQVLYLKYKSNHTILILISMELHLISQTLLLL